VKKNITADRYTSIIDSFSENLAKATTKEEVAWCVVDHVIPELDFQDCVVYLYDQRRKALIQTAAFGPKNVEGRKIKDPIFIEPGEGIVGRVFVFGRGRIVNDTSMDANYIIDDRFRLSEIAIPIKTSEKTIGVIDSEHMYEDFFTEQHKELLTEIADLVGKKMETLTD